MRIEFNRTGAERKALVNAVAEITGTKARYLGMPSANYEVDYFTITRDGALEFDDRADSEEIENLLEKLADRGIAAGSKDVAENWLLERDGKTAEEMETTPQKAIVGLTVEVPRDKVNTGNLLCLLEAKGELIKKALGIETVNIQEQDEKVSFPWFTKALDSETATAYIKFIGAICEMSVKQKRITAKPKENENEKYSFRCFLLRLGFIGDEHKADRKILLRKLDGSSAFKTGAKKGESES